ncbi:MAG: hypothetical protein WAS01_10350, partial [Nostocoides sp.]
RDERGRDDRRRDDRGSTQGSRPSYDASRGGAGRGFGGDNARSFGPRLVPTKTRLPEPAIAEGVTGKELDRDVWTQLRTLSKENAEGVAQHLVMVAVRLAENELDGALAHAETAVRRAGRVPAAREALGVVAYRLGDFARALAEFRTVRRISGSAHLLPLMVDSERGLGRLDRALELAGSPDAKRLEPSEQAELTIVVAGVRRDLGQFDAAILGLERAAYGPPRPWSARIYYAYADALVAKGDLEAARRWFAMASAMDSELETDAAERLDELDGVTIIESDAGADASTDPDADPT